MTQVPGDHAKVLAGTCGLTPERRLHDSFGLPRRRNTFHDSATLDNPDTDPVRLRRIFPDAECDVRPLNAFADLPTLHARVCEHG